MNAHIWEALTRVRLINDPGRVGVVTGEVQDALRPGRARQFQVLFADTTQWISGDQLEQVPVERECPYDLMRKGKLGGADDLRRVLTHTRLTGRLADVIYSMETTNTDFYPYQFKPVLSFLESPSKALLIADEVGLGKTIEAGLVWTELRSRDDLRRLVVLCPAMLREKWQRELDHKIGVKAEIVNAKRLAQHLQSPEAALDGFALICSQAGARPPRGWEDPRQPRGRMKGAIELARLLREHENNDALIDLLVIDEAHYLRNPESQTHRMGGLFRRVTENLLLLTATPIHNYNKDLLSLLRLLDSATFERAEDLERVLEASGPLVKAREHLLSITPTKDTLDVLLSEAARHPLLTENRQLQSAREALTDQDTLSNRKRRAELARQLETVNPLAGVITRTRKRDVKEWRVIREPVPEYVPMTAAEEVFYERVTGTVIEYAMQRDVSERFILCSPQRQMSSSMAATYRAWSQRRDNLDEVYLAGREETGTEKIGPLTMTLIDQLHTFGTYEDLKRNDSKYLRLETMLLEYLDSHPQEKIVLFSTYRETLNYVGERLEQAGISSIVMHGGVRESKDSILERFHNDTSSRVLLSSEVGSEGIDLQFCRVLINYDLPWNPMRVEQRIGRLDRLGQEASSILIWNLLYDETIDARIYKRLYEKLNLIQDAMGDFEAVLGDEVRELTIALMSEHLSPAQEQRRIDQTAQAMENLRNSEEELQEKAPNLVAHGDYIMRQIHAARDMGRQISGRDLRRYVIDFMRSHYPGCEFQQIEAGGDDYHVQLSAPAKESLDNCIRELRLPRKTRLVRNASTTVLCRFENRTVTSLGREVEVINQFHPLVRLVSLELTESAAQLTPAVSVQLPAAFVADRGLGPGDYLLAASRWSFHGIRTLERLMIYGMRLDAAPDCLLEADTAEHLANAAADRGADWFEGPFEHDPVVLADRLNQSLVAQLEDDFQLFHEDRRRQNEDRVDHQITNQVRYRAQQLVSLGAIKAKHLERGSSLAKATEGRIQAMLNDVERKMIKIERQRSSKAHDLQILAALIRLQP